MAHQLIGADRGEADAELPDEALVEVSLGELVPRRSAAPRFPQTALEEAAGVRQQLTDAVIHRACLHVPHSADTPMLANLDCGRERPSKEQATRDSDGELPHSRRAANRLSTRAQRGP